MKDFLVPYLGRLCFIIAGILLCPFLVIYCRHKGLKSFPSWAYYWDNEEDGFNGKKREGSDDIKGKKEYDKQLSKDSWLSDYYWCAIRNPAWNVRYHPYLSIDWSKCEILRYDGNTTEHTYKWSDKKLEGKKLYYNVTFRLDKRKIKSAFKLIPIFKSKAIYIRYGWKVYPSYKLNPYWVHRIKLEGYPPHKNRAVWVFSIRLKGIE